MIPIINCVDFDCVKERFKKAVEFGAEWVQFDVSDGQFTSVKNWNEPEKLIPSAKGGSASGGNTQHPTLNIEVHLMIEKPEKDVERWLRAGAKRIIVHIESEFDFEKVKKSCEEYSAELMLALKPETPIEKIFPYINGQISNIKLVQLLAVDPGLSSQKFQPQVLEKARILLKRREADIIAIEIDGGINPETARLARDAGIKIIASGSYIFESQNPEKAYRTLAVL